MSSLVVDTNVLAREALGNLETADQIGPAIERLRRRPEAAGPSQEPPALAMRMVAQ
jgi:hypothetical protein